MALEYSFSVEGFESLFKKMDELRDEIGKAKTDRIWRQCLLYAMEPVLNDAKTHAPEDTGQLRDHIYMKAHRPQMIDKGSFYYDGESYLVRVTSSPIRDDSVKKTILNKRGRFQSYYTNKKPVGVSQEFGNKRVRKHEFLKPALTDNMQKIQTRLGQAIMAQLDKMAGEK